MTPSTTPRLPNWLGIVASIPKRSIATAAAALCTLLLAMPTWGQEVSISLSTPDLTGETVSEDFGDIVFTVEADSDPSADVTVNFSVTGTTTSGEDYTALTATTVVIDGAGTGTTAPVTIVVIDDSIDEGADEPDAGETLIITLTSVTGGDSATLGSTANTYTYIIQDNDDAGLIITDEDGNPGDPLTLTIEESDFDRYLVSLSTQPTAPVTVTPSVTDGVTVAPSALTFFPTDNSGMNSGIWSTPLTVRVTATNNNTYSLANRSATVTNAVTSTGANRDTIYDDDSEVPNGTVNIIITEDDAEPTPGIPVLTPSSVGEGAGSTPINVSVPIEGRVFDADVTVRVTVGSGTGANAATEDTDFEAVTMVDIPVAAGGTVATDSFDFVPIPNDIDEADKTAEVTAFIIGFADTTGSRNLTINDDDTAGVTVTPTSRTIEEGDSSTYTVVLTSEPTANVVFTPSTHSEVTISPASFTFTAEDPGSATNTNEWNDPFTVTIESTENNTTDTYAPFNITHTVTSTDGGYSGISSEAVSVTISDDDQPGIVLTAGPRFEVAEGVTNATYVVSLASEPSVQVTVTMTVTGTDSADIGLSTADGGTMDILTFATGEWNTPRTVTVSAASDNDAHYEDDITVTHTAGQGDYMDITGTLNITVVDDEVPTLNISTDADGTNENSGPMVFTVSLTNAAHLSAHNIVLNYATNDGATGTTADAGDDYTAIAATPLTITAGTSSMTFTVDLTEDTHHESHENIVVRLSDLSDALGGDTRSTKAPVFLGGGDALADTGTINDDDNAPTTLTLSVNMPSVTEGTGSANNIVITATASGTFGYDQTVTVAVGAGTDGAMEGTDYPTVDDIEIIIPGNVGSGAVNTGTGTISFQPPTDSLHEHPETVSVTGTFTPARGSAVNTTEDTDTMLTIVNADADAAPSAITLSLNTPVVEEEDATTPEIVVTATLIGNAFGYQETVAVSVGTGTGDHGAVSGEDFAAVGDFVITIAEGASSGTNSFTFNPTNDEIDELDNEPVSVSGTLVLDTSSTDEEVTTNGTTFTIEDDEASPMFIDLRVVADDGSTVTSPSLDEDDGETSITVEASFTSPARSLPTVIQLRVNDGDGAMATERNGTAVTDINNEINNDYFVQTPDRSATIASGQTVATITIPGDSSTKEVSTTINFNVVNDRVDDDAETFTIAVHAADIFPAELTTTATDPTDLRSVTVTINDDDIRGFDLLAQADLTGANAVHEDGAVATYNVQLSSRPSTTDAVVVDLSASSKLAVTTATANRLTFAANQWNVAQPVTVSGTSDDDAHYELDLVVTHTVNNTDTAGGDYRRTTGDNAPVSNIQRTGTLPNDGVLPAGVQPTTELLITVNDDETPTLTISSNPTDENNGWIEFTVALSESDQVSVHEIQLTFTTIDDLDKNPQNADNETKARADTYVDTIDNHAISDYTAVDDDTTVVLDADSPMTTFRVELDNDTHHEDDEETFVVRLANLVDNGGDVNSTTRETDVPVFLGREATLDTTATILDSDPEPSVIRLVVTPNNVDEEVSGDPEIVVTATLENNLREHRTFGERRTVVVDVASGSGADAAVEGTDFETEANFEFVILPGDASAQGTFFLDPVDDVTDEEDEMISITGTISDNVTGPPTELVGTTTLTINDNEESPMRIDLSVDGETTVGLDEGTAEHILMVTAAFATPARDSDTIVSLSVGDPTDEATRGPADSNDYSATGDIGTDLTILPNTMSVTGTITITVRDDRINEGDGENFTISVSSTLADITEDPGDITVTIEDNDTSGIDLLTTTALTVVEEATATYAVALSSQPEGGNVVVTMTPQPGDDDPDDPDDPEAFTARSSADTTMLTFTPTDWDDPQLVTVAGLADIDAIDDIDLTVGYSAVYADSSTTNEDYGTAVTTIYRTPDSLPAGVQRTDQLIIRVDDNDAPTVYISTSDGHGTSSADEPSTVGVVFTVSLRHVSAHDTIMTYHTVDGTAITTGSGGTPHQGTDDIEVGLIDFEAVAPFDAAEPAAASTLTIRKGTMMSTITIPLNDDLVYEVREEFQVVLSNVATQRPSGEPELTSEAPVFEADAPGGGGVTNPTTLTFTGRIIENDPAPERIDLSLSHDTLAEGDGGDNLEVVVTASVISPAGAATPAKYNEEKTVTVTLNPASLYDDEPGAVDYTTSTPSVITIPLGAVAATGTFTVTPTPDDVPLADFVVEADSTITVEGEANVGTLPIAQPNVVSTETTLKDRQAPTQIELSMTPEEVSEDLGTQMFTVTASFSENEGAASTVTRNSNTEVLVTIVTDTATIVAAPGTGADVMVSNSVQQTITVLATEPSGEVVFAVTPHDDILHEDNETFGIDAVVTAMPLIVPGNELSTRPIPAITSGKITVIDDDTDFPRGISLSLSADADSPLDELSEDIDRIIVEVTATVDGITGTFYDDEVTVAITVTGTGSGTADDHADRGVVDYTTEPPSGTFNINIPANQSSATGTFTIFPTNDVAAELDNVITVSGEAAITVLNEETPTTIPVTSATLTIRDDEQPPTAATLSLADGSDELAENGMNQEVVVIATLSDGKARNTDSTIKVTLVSDTSTVEARPFTDTADIEVQHDSLTQTLTIPAGSVTGTFTFTVEPVNDILYEVGEQFRITRDPLVLMGTDANASTPAGPFPQLIVTVNDEDPLPEPEEFTLTLSRYTLDEHAGASDIVVTSTFSRVVLADVAEVEVEVSVAPDGITATNEDYNDGDTITIPIPVESPAATGVVNLAPVDDRIDETYQTRDNENQTLVFTGVATFRVTNPLDASVTSTSITTTVTLDIIDNETAALVLTDVLDAEPAEDDAEEPDDPVPGSLTSATITEEIEINRYSIALSTQPLEDVTVDITATRPTKASVSPVQVMFTPDNWGDPQTITIYGTVDVDTVDEALMLVHDASSAGNEEDPGDPRYRYNVLADHLIDLTVVDNDAWRAVPDPNPLTINETDTDPTYVVSLSTNPGAQATVTLTNTTSDVITAVSPTELTFTPTLNDPAGDGWNEPQTITLTVAHDDDALDDLVTITYTGTAGQPAEAPVTQVITVVDDDKDKRGIVLTPTVAAMPEVMPEPEPEETPGETPEETPGGGGDTGMNGGGTAMTGDTAMTEDDTPTAVEVAEGGSGTYTVQLGTEPGAQVVVEVTEYDRSLVTVSPARLTFTTTRDDPNGNGWNQPQTVTVSGVQDGNDENEPGRAIKHVARGGDYEGMEVMQSFNVTDDDCMTVEGEEDPVCTVTPAFSITDATQLEGRMEGNDTETMQFMVTLDVAPIANSTVTVEYATSDGTARQPADYATASDTLTFTGQEMAKPIHVTLTNDDADENDETFTVTLSNPSANAAIAVATATGTIVDDDGASVEISQSTLDVHENASSEYTVVLTEAPQGAVTVTLDVEGDSVGVASTPQGAVTVTLDVDADADDDEPPPPTTAPLIFDELNFNVPQTVTIAAAIDANADDEVLTITHAVTSTADPTYDGVEPVYQDGAGNGVVGAAEVTVTAVDAGASPSLSRLSITSQPANGSSFLAGDTIEVTMTISPASMGQTIAVDATTQGTPRRLLRLQIGDNLRPATLDLEDSAADDDDYNLVFTYDVVLGDRAEDGISLPEDALTLEDLQITYGEGVPVDTISLAAYEGATPTTPLDPNGYAVGSDTAELHIVSPDAVAESASEIVFTVMAPETLGEFTVEYSTADGTATAGADYVAVAAGTLTVGANGMGLITIELPADDNIDEADEETFTVTLSGDALDDVPTGTMTVATGTITDNDDASFSITDAADEAITTISVFEGQSVTYMVALDTQPTAPVTLGITATDDMGNADDDTKVSISDTPLTFTAENYATVRTVTIQSLGDDDEGDVMLTLTHDIGSADDAMFEALANIEVHLTVEDDDAQGLHVAQDDAPVPEGGISVAEGETSVYAVQLTTQPKQPVTVAITSDAAGTEDDDVLTAITPAALIFTEDDWNTAQPVTVTAASDNDADDETATIEHAVSSDDVGYGAEQGGTLAVAITDPQETGVTVGMASIALTEEEQATYTVVLDTDPLAEVTLALAFTDEEQQDASVMQASLVFTDENWNTEQTVTVSALKDDDGQDELLTLTHTATGGAYDDHEGPHVTIEIADNDAPRILSVGLARTSAPMGDDTYGVGETITFQVAFTRPVAVRGSPQLRITLGEKERLADYVPPLAEASAEPPAEPPAEASAEPLAQEDHAPGTTVRFAYTIQSDDMAPDGIAIPDNPITYETGEDIVSAEDENVSAFVVPDMAVFEMNVPAETTKVDGTKDFMLVAKAGDDKEATENSTVTLIGSADSGEMAMVNYAWSLKGSDAPAWLELTPVKDDPTTATFDIPNIRSSLDLTFVLTVTNKRTEDVDTDEVLVKITAVNDTPTAVIAGDAIRSEEEGTDVVLSDGGSSDPEGEALTYAWRLAEGNPSYVLDIVDDNTAKATVKLGVNVPNETTLKIELAVTDPGGETGTATVTIVVTSTPLGQVLEHALSRFGRTLASSAVDTLGERFGTTPARSTSGGLAMNLGGTQMNFASIAKMMPQGAAAPGTENTQGMAANGLMLNGTNGAADGMAVNSMHGAAGGMANNIFTADHFSERMLATRGLHLPTFDRNALMRSTFEVNLGGGNDALGASSAVGDAASANWSIWGSLDNRTFEADPTDAINLDGSTTITYIGLDARLGQTQDVVIGLAIGSADSDVEYVMGDLEGDVALRMVSLYPYTSWTLSDSLSVWGMVGVGNGDAQVTSDKRHDLETDIGMLMFAAGGRNDFASASQAKLALKADAFIANTDADDLVHRDIEDIATSVQRARVGLELSNPFTIDTASSFQPSIELSARVDGGDAETGVGMEVNATFAYINTFGFSAEARVRHLLVHTDEDIAETGISMMFLYDPSGPSTGGLSARLTPTWGDMQSAAQAMWQADQPMFGHTTGLGQSATGEAATFGMNAELQYDILLHKWSIAPYGSMNVNGTAGHEQWGLRINALKMESGDLSLDFFGQQDGRQQEQAINPGVKATLNLRF